MARFNLRNNSKSDLVTFTQPVVGTDPITNGTFVIESAYILNDIYYGDGLYGENVNKLQALVTTGYTDFGVSMLVILGGLIGIAVGFLVFKVGWAYTKRKSMH